MNIFLIFVMLLSPYIGAQSRPDDGNYFSEDYNPSDPNIDEKHVGSLSTATPSEQVVEKKITRYYKSHGKLSDDVWQSWLGKNFEEVYVIQPHDTLWDISAKFLDSPWYWPKIWELNQYITNPHWIYPGNELKFSYSGKTGPKITVIRKKKGKRYSEIVDVVPNLFDKTGFYRPRYNELLSANKNIRSSINGGQLCLGEHPAFAGLIEASTKNATIFSNDDDIQIYMENMQNCEQGTKYVAVEGAASGIYKIHGLIEIEGKSILNRRCKAKVLEIYGEVKRDMHIMNVPVQESELKNAKDTLVADVYYIDPSEQRQLGSENDRVCIKFRRNAKSIEPGTMVYFYEADDPDNKRTMDPYVLAAGQVIHINRDVATVLLVASQKERPITRKTLVTTRF